MARDVDDSAAISLSWIPKIIGTAVNFLSGSNNNQQRDYFEYEAREYDDDEDDSGAIIQSIIRGPPVRTWTDANGTVHRVPFYWGQLPVIKSTGLQARELHELLLRAAEDDESGAGIFNIVKNVGSLLFHGISALTGGSNNQQQRRELYELVARAADGELSESDAINLTSILKGGLSLIPTVLGFLPHGSSGNSTSSRREYDDVYELLARDADDDESGAGIFNIVKNVGSLIFHGISALTGSNNNQQQRREFVEIMTRAASDEMTESDAINLKNIVKVGLPFIGPIINGITSLIPSHSSNGTNARRELEGAYTLLARAVEDDDESGAGIFNIIKTVGGALIKGIGALTGGSSNQQQQRREYDTVFELLARAAEDDDESGAGIFNIVKNVGSLIFHGISALTGSNNQQQQRRDYDAVYELLARAAEDDDESGAGLFSIFKTVGGALLKGIGALTGGGNNQQQRRAFEDIVELVARADYDME